LRKYHINYANGRYLKAQQYCSQSAKQVGFDDVISYSFNDIDSEFLEKNKHILSQSRGAGYWIWKPYFISKTLERMNGGDLLVYSDSGSIYQASIQPLIDVIKFDKHGVLSFELKGLIEKDYTKKDAFVMMGLDESKYTDTSQREATYIWLIKNDFTVKLINEYLVYAQNENIITDLPNITGDNYSTFKDHRHDQSIWSLLCKKYDVEPHRLISQHGLHLINDFPNDKWSQITLHHRNPI
jgi:hypothetical protein